MADHSKVLGKSVDFKASLFLEDSKHQLSQISSVKESIQKKALLSDYY